MIELGNSGSRLVDATVLLVMYLLRNLILLFRVCDNLLAFEPQLLRLVVVAQGELVVGRSASKTALLCSVGAIGVLSVLEVETDLVEALFRYKLVVLPQISSVYDGVD